MANETDRTARLKLIDRSKENVFDNKTTTPVVAGTGNQDEGTEQSKKDNTDTTECETNNGKKTISTENNTGSPKINKTYTCQYCEKNYLKHTSFHYHLVKMHGKSVKNYKPRKPKPFLCDELSNIINSNSHQENSNLTKNEENSSQSLGYLYECYHCEKTFPDSAKLSEHVDQYTSTPFRCKQCLEPFSDVDDLEKHIQQHITDANIQFECEHCYKVFTQKRKLEIHLRYHNLQQPAIEANTVSEHGSILRLFLTKQSDAVKITGFNELHVLGHEKELNRCDHCEECFKTGDLLSEHIMVTHSNSIPDELIQCDLPADVFTHVDSSSKRMEHHSQDSQYECRYCHKIFLKMSDLRNHLKSEPQKFCCMYCDRYYIRCSSFQDHLRTHTGEKPFVCDQCGKAFSAHGLLQTHRLIHIPTKIYSCDQCSKTFYRKCNLDVHYRKHTCEKPYMCPECGNQFSHSSALKRHRRQHTGERPYICDICGMGYVGSSNLMAHRRKHTGEKIYECKPCGIKYSRSGTLRRHKLKFHPN